MHLVGLAFEPPEKSAHTVPPIVFVIFVRVFARTFFAFDHELLIGLWQLLEWHIDSDLLARAGAEQVLL